MKAKPFSKARSIEIRRERCPWLPAPLQAPCTQRAAEPQSSGSTRGILCIANTGLDHLSMCDLVKLLPFFFLLLLFFQPAKWHASSPPLLTHSPPQDGAAVTSPILTHSDWLAGGGKRIVPAALSEKLRERESERVETWEGKTGAGSVGDRKERERDGEREGEADRD